MKKYLASLLITLFSCGTKEGTQPTSSPSLEVEIARISPLLSTCTVENIQYYSRPLCDLGDAWTLNAAMALVDPVSAKRFADNSIATDGRPFRSPLHLQRFESGDKASDVTSNSFSRDHVISLLFYTIWSKDPIPLSKIWEYATSNNLKVCTGTSSQCLLTPAMLDQIGDVFAYLNKPRPWQTKVPGAANAIVQIASIPSISSWQLTLAAEHVLIKTVTGNLNSTWSSLAENILEKVPNNLFYRFVRDAATSNTEDIKVVGEELAKTMEAFKTPGKQWFWNDQNPDTATGVDLIFLAKLIIDGTER